MTDDPRDEDDQNVGAFVKLEGIAGRIEHQEISEGLIFPVRVDNYVTF
jgi:hypothetical protein